MFIFDFVAETILDQILDWIYGKIIGFLNDFFVMMNNMGVELFELGSMRMFLRSGMKKTKLS